MGGGSRSTWVLGGVVVIGAMVFSAGWAKRRAAQLSALGLRSALALFGCLPAEAGSFHGWVSTPSRLRQREAVLHETLRSAPGGRGTFFVRTKKVPKESRPASTPRLCRGALRCSRRRGPAELALAALGAQTVLGPAVLRTSEPDNAALLGVSEGEGEASTLSCCPNLVARMQAAGRNAGSAAEHLGAPLPDAEPFRPGYEFAMHGETATVLILGPVESAEQRSELGESARSDDGEDCLRPVGPSSAAARFREHAREVRHLCLTANGVSGVSRSTASCRWSGQCVQTLHYFGSPFLGYFFWRSKRSNTPAGGGTPAKARQQTASANLKPHPSKAGLSKALPNRQTQTSQRAACQRRHPNIQNPEARPASPFTTIPLRENRS